MTQTAIKYQPYPKYKTSGIAWLGDSPDAWEAKRLKYLFKVENGATPRSDKEEFWDGEILWVTPDDLGSLDSLYIQDTSRKITEKGFQSCGTTIVPKGSIILSTRAPIGHMGVATTDICTNQGCRALVFRKHDLAKEYYYYLFGAAKSELQSLGQGSTFLELSTTKLKSVFMPVPSEDDAVAIVDFLNYKTGVIEDVIARKQKLIELLKEKRQALITHAVTKGLDPNAKLKPSGIEWLGDIPEGWEVKRLKFKVKINPSKNESINLPLESEVSFIPMEAVSEDGSINLNGIKSLEEVIEGYTYFRNGDVVIAKITPCFENGKGTLMSGLKNGIGFGTTEFHVLRPSCIDAKYLYLLTTIHPFRKFGEANMKGAAGQKRVPEEFVKDFTLGFPSISEQRTIVDFLDHETAKIDTVMGKIKTQIEKLIEYRQALITSAVTGKFKVS